jgi:hypothetical protein
MPATAMSDIFVSYSSQERDRILPLVKALEKTGWSVFWDRTIPAGKTWRQVIGSEIVTSRSVLVVWTENSVASEWVLEEAETGKRRRILIPILLDDVEPPFGFGNIQAANLTAWNGDNSSASFTHLVADLATILGTAPTAAKETGKRRRSDADTQRKAEEERLREQERQRSEEDARLKAEQENQKQIEQKVTRQAEPGSERFKRLDKGRLYTAGAVVTAIALAVLAFWFFGLSGNRIVSVEIQGKRQLKAGEKTVLRVGGRFSDGRETDVTKNLDWESSDDSVVAVSRNGQVVARKEGFADITVRYEGLVSSPLTLMVRGENQSTEANMARVTAKIQEYIKTAGIHRDRGEYSDALAVLAKAKSLDPENKAIQSELESTKKACLAEQRIALTNLRCDERVIDEGKRP